MKKNQKGFGAVEGLLILVIVGIVGFVGWYVMHSKNQTDSIYNKAANTSISTKTGSTAKSKSSTAKSTSSASASSGSSSSQSVAASSTTSLLSGALTVTLPANWTKLSDTSIGRTLNGSKYVASFSLSSQDTLTASSPYENDGSDLGSVYDTKSTQLWLNRSDADTYNSWVYVSGCEPGICSPKLNGQYLFILLSDQTSGTPQKLFFRYSDSDANTVVGDFFDILKTANI